MTEYISHLQTNKDILILQSKKNIKQVLFNAQYLIVGSKREEVLYYINS
jgi:hypothetical protein